MSLPPLNGEKLPKGSITSPGARLNVSARNLWSPLAKAFIDVRVFKIPKPKPTGKRVFLKCTIVMRTNRSKDTSHEPFYCQFPGTV